MHLFSCSSIWIIFAENSCFLIWLGLHLKKKEKMKLHIFWRQTRTSLVGTNGFGDELGSQNIFRESPIPQHIVVCLYFFIRCVYNGNNKLQRAMPSAYYNTTIYFYLWNEPVDSVQENDSCLVLWIQNLPLSCRWTCSCRRCGSKEAFGPVASKNMFFLLRGQSRWEDSDDTRPLSPPTHSTSFPCCGPLSSSRVAVATEQGQKGRVGGF